MSCLHEAIANIPDKEMQGKRWSRKQARWTFWTYIPELIRSASNSDGHQGQSPSHRHQSQQLTSSSMQSTRRHHHRPNIRGRFLPHRHFHLPSSHARRTRLPPSGAALRPLRNQAPRMVRTDPTRSPASARIIIEGLVSFGCRRLANHVLLELESARDVGRRREHSSASSGAPCRARRLCDERSCRHSRYRRIRQANFHT